VQLAITFGGTYSTKIVQPIRVPSKRNLLSSNSAYLRSLLPSDSSCPEPSSPRTRISPCLERRHRLPWWWRKSFSTRARRGPGVGASEGLGGYRADRRRRYAQGGWPRPPRPMWTRQRYPHRHEGPGERGTPRRHSNAPARLGCRGRLAAGVHPSWLCPVSASAISVTHEEQAPEHEAMAASRAEHVPKKSRVTLKY
jgi:hypothetical protein